MEHNTLREAAPVPYYDDGVVTLYHGNCRTITAWLDANVLITDPPYGVAYKSNKVRGRDQRIAGDEDTTIRSIALDMWHATDPDRPALVFGRWDIERPAGTRHRLIWDKQVVGMGDLGMPWGMGEEEVYVLGRGFAGRRGTNVIRAQGYAVGDKRRPNHPTPKPVALMEALIEKCPPGIIADPFAGSGATLIAARNMGRRAIGVEIDRGYCQMIAERLSQQSFAFMPLDETGPKLYASESIGFDLDGIN